MNDEQKGAGDDYPVFEKFTVLGENNAVATDVTITKQQSIEEAADEYGAYCYEACSVSGVYDVESANTNLNTKNTNF